MNDKSELLYNIDKLHTTDMGVDRIKRNLSLSEDVVEHCKKIITDENCRIYKQGKNWYCETDKVIITVNSSSYTIITAHRNKG